MPDTPTNEPLELRAGLTWAWRREDLSASYPAPSWTLTYWFKKLEGDANFSIAATASGLFFAIAQTAAQTAARVAGKYSWTAIVTGGSSEAYEVDSGVLEVLPRYDQAANLDDRSHARRMLANCEAAIEALQLGAAEFSFANRTFKRTDLDELYTMRSKYQVEVQSEDASEAMRNGLGNPRYFRTRFDRT